MMNSLRGKLSLNMSLFGSQPSEQATLQFPKPILTATDGVRRLKIVTYNVWFDIYQRKERTNALFALLRTLEADVICLQEATRAFVVHLTQDEWIMKHYAMSDAGRGDSVVPYGVLTLTRFPCRFETVAFPTQMGRLLLCTELVINKEKIAIGNVHFESLSNAQLRKEQYTIAHKKLSSYHTALLMGDFNFCSERNYSSLEPTENIAFAAHYKDYIDLWPALHPGDKGFTFDSHVNKMIHQEEQMRYDRMVLRSSTWKPVKMEILGSQQLPEIQRPTWISDHFGLYVELESTAN
eukprot:TRINITY_DN3821_c0_g1_i1.p1 TRINITY_DN3821_c0_g1~~TRINITY_DN3821_c0_g1_i1.p1  ORF type:complete len:294 (+),score=60.33 TRINITY_DN3821_c0_g1_i1:72-953(+)